MTYLDKKTTAKMIGVSTRTVQRMCQRHELTPTRIGAVPLFSRDQVERYVRIHGARSAKPA